VLLKKAVGRIDYFLFNFAYEFTRLLDGADATSAKGRLFHPSASFAARPAPSPTERRLRRIRLCRFPVGHNEAIAGY